MNSEQQADLEGRILMLEVLAQLFLTEHFRRADSIQDDAAGVTRSCAIAFASAPRAVQEKATARLHAVIKASVKSAEALPPVT